MSDYKKTLHLPNTSFPMKANLVQNEPEMLNWWETIDVYSKMLSISGRKGVFLLHDGPPYANGHIHLGTALNKILKDIIVKSRNMQGYHTRFVPGWDCHGLPIELKVEQDLGEKKHKYTPSMFRKSCRDYARKFLEIQKKEFKRLGVFGEWEHPYLTMDPSYEATTAAELAHFVERGSLFRSKKPIYWCYSCETALAEAEVEYKEHTSSSIFVRFPIDDPAIYKIFPEIHDQKVAIIIWTTTPWTLPSNMAISVHPDFDYVIISHDNEYSIIGKERLEACKEIFHWKDVKCISTVKGIELEGIKARHPFYDRDSVIVLGEHVTLESGTGCVHTAPGHGREDYEVALKYNLDIYSPLDDQGRYLDSVKFFAGMRVDQANTAVIEKLNESHCLIHSSSIEHSYPHCWRCSSPVIFRATTQWFISMEETELRTRALQAIKSNVNWIPAWGEERIYSMIQTRPDWCISRQRTWGVPIIALLCEGCGAVWNEPSWMRKIAFGFASYSTGCDYWYEADSNDIVPEGLICSSCGGSRWKREMDILDVWFDSGTSFAAVMEQYSGLGYPADLYLEGSDQHRGWFHSSLLVSVETRGVPPYNTVLTHGYVVDGDGRKMSKSIGNVIVPQEIIDKFGAEILRLWVASVDYKEEIRISDEILQRLVDAYRRIRNTCRYILGNIGDMKAEHYISTADMDALDQHILGVVSSAYLQIQEAYTKYDFHNVFHTLHNVCTIELSAFYLDVVKDRLYAFGKESVERRSAQTALVHIVHMLLHAMAPILSFTAEEVYRYFPEALKDQNIETVFALPSPDVEQFFLDESLRQTWNVILAIRSEVTHAIEPMRKEGVIGHSLDTHIILYLSPEIHTLLLSMNTELRSIFIVSKLELKALTEAPEDAVFSELKGLAIVVLKSKGCKCERCWIYSEDLGIDSNHPNLCFRCTAAVKDMQLDKV